MNKTHLKKLLIIISISVAMSSCSKKEATDSFDFSNFKPPNRKTEINNYNNAAKPEIELKNKLISLNKRNEISSSIKYGKNNPFSSLEYDSNKSINNLKLKGFVSFNLKNYALIEFKNQQGLINISSVGGVNTKLLPKEAFVKEINPSQEEIKLLLEGEIHTIKLTF